jgi:DNA-binding transcriptional MocR family regulator
MKTPRGVSPASAPGPAAARAEDQPAFRYRQLAGEIERRILDGTYAPGERLPSIRGLHRQTNLSISTVYQAYMELLATGFIEARPKSGYFVLPVSLRDFEPPVFRKRSSAPQRVDLAPVVNSVVAAMSDPRLVPLGNTAADASLLPVKALARILKSLNQEDMRALLSYSPSEGLPELRRQVAIRTLGVIEGIQPEDVVITNGCTEAVALSLLAVTRAGDTVAVETPTNFTFLQLLKELGLLVAEIAADPRDGVDLEELEAALRGGRIKACLLMPNFQNPLGALMPETKKRALVELINRYEVPVVEDDISAQLHFGETRPAPLKAYDRGDRVLTCTSFSKTLAPGLRLGWVIPGRRYRARIQRLKAGTTISTSTLDQVLVARFLETGAYERHLRALRNALKRQVFTAAMEIRKCFPANTRLAVPQGGSLLWVELPQGVDGLDVYQRAFARDISIIPGVVCSNSKQFTRYIQISCAAPFRRRIRDAVRTLGEIVSELAGQRRVRRSRGDRARA